MLGLAQNTAGEPGALKKPILLFQHYRWESSNFKDSGYWWEKTQASELIDLPCRKGHLQVKDNR